MNSWWRAYNEAVNDPKLQLLSDALFRAWFNLMCIASGNGGVIPPLRDIAFTLRLTEAKAAGILTQLHSAGLLDKTETGFAPHNWDGRQYKSDVSNERVKRFRERKRNVTTAVTVTAPEQSRTDTEQSRADAGRLQNEISEKWGFDDTARVIDWIALGYSETLILTTMAELLARKPRINGLAYFDGALAEAHKKQPASPSDARAAIDWDKTVKLWMQIGVWSKWAGPEPGAVGCRAPAEVFAKHGLGADGKKLKAPA